MRFSDRFTGAILVILGAASYWGGSKLPPVPGQQVGPNVFPMVVGAALLICGLLIIVGIGRSFEEEEKRSSAQDSDLPKPALWKILLPPAALFFYAFASEKLGFWITATLMVLTLARSYGAKWKASLALALFAPVFVHLIFYKLLRVPLPPGLLKFPWA